MVITYLHLTFLDVYKSMLNSLPFWARDFINFFLLVLFIMFYSILVWKFYKFISQKNPLGLNLNEKYHPNKTNFFTRVIAGIIYFIEYALILPLLVFVIFTVFTFFLIMLSQAQEISQILLISATVIAVIRITSYYKEELSQEIAKILPFMLLAVAVLNPDTLIKSQYLERIINHLSVIPSFINQIGNYLFFIIGIELILMFFDTIFSLLGVNDEDETAEEKKK